MYSDMFKTFNEHTEKQLLPMVKFNQLLCKNIEALTELQLNAMRSYSDIGLAQLKAASDIKDPASLGAFTTQQLASMAQFSKQIVEDSNQFQTVANEFREELEKLTRDNLKA